ncbi:hypothetical protein AB0L00_33180 [Actinoallomurus sp. NPDC052308]|uniref:hypothetical protein n=1 Tax=Actinoallomurus sp. NPDC052308 TaxID=3155530 RepID=UPI003437FAEB
MRRIVTALGALPLGGLLTLTVPTAAHAADGKLIISHKTYKNPSGCYGSDRGPLRVSNKTDHPALIFNKPDCKGWPAWILRPGQSVAWESGLSVSIK